MKTWSRFGASERLRWLPVEEDGDEPDDWTGFYGSKSFGLMVGGGMTFNIEGGTVRIADRLFLYAGGTLNVTGGLIRPKRTFTGYGLVNGHEYTNPCRVAVDGGVFKSSQAIFFRVRRQQYPPPRRFPSR